MTCPRTVSRIARLRYALRPSCLPHRMAQGMALAVIIGALSVLGCSGDDSSPIATATASDLNNRAFAFPNGAGARDRRGVRIAARAGIYPAI